MKEKDNIIQKIIELLPEGPFRLELSSTEHEYVALLKSKNNEILLERTAPLTEIDFKEKVIKDPLINYLIASWDYLKQEMDRQQNFTPTP